MRILFFKASPSDSSLDAEQLPIDEKLRRILELHVKEAKTEDDRERAERELAGLKQQSDVSNQR